MTDIDAIALERSELSLLTHIVIKTRLGPFKQRDKRISACEQFWVFLYLHPILFFCFWSGSPRTPLEGATSLINAAVNPALAGVIGMYYKDCKDGYKSSVARYVVKGKRDNWRGGIPFINVFTFHLRCTPNGKRFSARSNCFPFREDSSYRRSFMCRKASSMQQNCQKISKMIFSPLGLMNSYWKCHCTFKTNIPGDLLKEITKERKSKLILQSRKMFLTLHCVTLSNVDCNIREKSENLFSISRSIII